MSALPMRYLVVAAAVATILTFGAVLGASASNGGNRQDDLAAVRSAVAGFHSVDAAEDAGWGLIPGLDSCFHSDEGGMGIHYINTELLDTSLDPLQPEALVYQHLPNGELHLGAVEYIVPAAAWDAENHGHAPMVLGKHLHLNQTLGVYVLHAWIFKHNPAEDGMFQDWNPNVSCPNLTAD
ncbi:MAG TPA: hypothetical protein VFH62_02250 [Dehalococcoidia bacterium]|nr:hypothetical protein [Dehalococcoidia bacterium]